MRKRRSIGVRMRRGGVAAAALLSGYLLCRYAFFGLHGMAELPGTLFLPGLAVVAVAAMLDARWVPLCTPAGYAVGFVAAMLLRTDGADPGGGTTDNGWILWTGFFLAAILAGIVLDCAGGKKTP